MEIDRGTRSWVHLQKVPRVQRDLLGGCDVKFIRGSSAIFKQLPLLWGFR